MSKLEIEAEVAEKLGFNIEQEPTLQQLGLLAIGMMEALKPNEGEEEYGVKVRDNDVSVNPETIEGRRFLQAINNDKKWDYLKRDPEVKMDEKPIIIAIVGHSGSGKTRLAKEITKILNEDQGGTAVDFGCDNFYGPGGKIKIEMLDGEVKELGVTLTTYDAPGALDCELYINVVKSLSEGRAGILPEYDMTKHQRVEGKEIIVSPQKVIILDGIMLLDMLATINGDGSENFKLLNLVDHLIVMDVDFETAFSRRMDRDIAPVEKGGRGRSEGDILAQKPSVEAGAEKYVDPLMVVVNGSDNGGIVDNGRVAMYREILKVFEANGGKVTMASNPPAVLSVGQASPALLEEAKEIVNSILLM